MHDDIIRSQFKKDPKSERETEIQRERERGRERTKQKEGGGSVSIKMRSLYKKGYKNSMGPPTSAYSKRHHIIILFI